MNRIDRLTAIITFMQGRQRVTVEELSERYDISTRTVYRDLRALQEGGIPIGSEAGEGYFIASGYHLPPVMFDRNEAAALLAGDRLMQKWDHTELGKAYHNALDKIRAILPHREKEYFDTLDRHIKAFHYRNENEPEPDDRIFGFLQNAIYKKEVVRIEYFSPYSRETTRRDVEPMGLLLMGNHWYLAGWCRLREDYRSFRLDRFRKFSPTGIRISDTSGHSLQEYYEQYLHEEKDLREVVVRFGKEVLRYVGDQKYWHGWAWEEEVEDGVEMTFLCSHLEFFCRWLLLWGKGIKIIRPAEVEERVAVLSEELYHHYVTPAGTE